jgi:membrane protease YdiL (CAAX protease family)
MSTEPNLEDVLLVRKAPVPAEGTALPRRSAPRVWTVFAAYAAALVGAVILQVIAVVALVAWQVARGADPQEVVTRLPETVTAPLAFILLASLSQLVVGMAAIVPAWLSPEPTLSRLGLVRPALPGWGYAVLPLGSVVPLALGLAFAYALAQVLPPDRSGELLYNQMTWSAAVPFILFIALAPGLLEELLFRGYIQRRLLERWSPWTAILITSALFTVMHVTPHAMVAVIPLAIWLCVIAWRTGSVWPGVVCHAFVNGSWNVLQVGRKLAGWPETPPVVATVALGVVVLGCFAGSIWVLTRRRPEAQAAPTTPPQVVAT